MKIFDSKVGYISFVLIMILMFCALSGCSAIDINLKINEDDTIDVSSFLGFTQDFLDLEWVNEIVDDTNEELIYREYNGVVYKGSYGEGVAESLDVFNESFEIDNVDDLVMEYLNVTKDEQGYYTFIYKDRTAGVYESMDPSVYDMPEVIRDEKMQEYLEQMEEQAKMYMKDLYFSLCFTFPSKVYQVSGETDGIVMDDNKVTIIRTELKIAQEDYDENAGKYVFSTNPKYAKEESKSIVKEDGIHVIVNEVNVDWIDVEPFIDENNRTMVPLRVVAEALGLKVDWYGESKEAVFYNEGESKYLVFTVAEKIAQGYVLTDNNDKEEMVEINMDTEAVIVNDRTYAPIRYLAEYFSCSVDWDGSTNTVIIYHKLR